MKRCKECTLLRVENEGETCAECIANGAYPAQPYTFTFEPCSTVTSSESVTSTNWYDAVHGLFP